MRTSQCLPPGETTAVALTLRSPAGDCWWQTVGTMAPLFSSRLRSLRSASLRGPASGSAARLSILWTLPVRTFFAICFLARSWIGCGFGGDFLRADGGGAVAAARARRAWPRVVGAIRSAFDLVPRAYSLTYEIARDPLPLPSALAIFPCLLVGWCPIRTITTGSALRSLSVQHCDGEYGSPKVQGAAFRAGA